MENVFQPAFLSVGRAHRNTQNSLAHARPRRKGLIGDCPEVGLEFGHSKSNPGHKA
jgi:hypothetical protein